MTLKRESIRLTFHCEESIRSADGMFNVTCGGQRYCVASAQNGEIMITVCERCDTAAVPIDALPPEMRP